MSSDCNRRLRRRQILEDLRSLNYLARFSFCTLISVSVYIIILLLAWLPSQCSAECKQKIREFIWRHYIRRAAWICLKAAGQKLIIKGRVPNVSDGPLIYLANHLSFLDAFLLALAITHRITALGAKSYFSLPFWGWMMRLHGVIPVDRRDHEKALESIALCERAIAERQSILIFPEGSRSWDGKIQPFKKGAIHLAYGTGATIIPIVIFDAHENWSRGSWRIRPGTLTVEFLQPLTAEEYRDFSINEIKSIIYCDIHCAQLKRASLQRIRREK